MKRNRNSRQSNHVPFMAKAAILILALIIVYVAANAMVNMIEQAAAVLTGIF